MCLPVKHETELNFGKFTEKLDMRSTHVVLREVEIIEISNFGVKIK